MRLLLKEEGANTSFGVRHTIALKLAEMIAVCQIPLRNPPQRELLPFLGPLCKMRLQRLPPPQLRGRWRAKAAGIETRIGNHTFRATGVTAYLKNSGKLEVAQQIANHESPRTTKLYDRRQDEISLDEIERITI